MNHSGNGRINMSKVEPDANMDKLFSMYDRIPVNAPVSVRDTINGNISHTPLSRAFFSKANTKIIQNAIRASIYKKTNQQFIIPEQSGDDLFLIMERVYLEHSLNRSENPKKQIEELNNMVIGMCVPKVYSTLISYNKYLRDVDTLVMPIDRPLSTYEDKELPKINYGFGEAKKKN